VKPDRQLADCRNPAYSGSFVRSSCIEFSENPTTSLVADTISHRDTKKDRQESIESDLVITESFLCYFVKNAWSVNEILTAVRAYNSPTRTDSSVVLNLVLTVTKRVFFIIYFNIIVAFMLRLHIWSIILKFSYQNFLCTYFSSPNKCSMPHLSFIVSLR
jgi:hypothetical protein